MEAIVERVAGLDVHQKTVVACVLSGAAGQRPKKEVRTFGTTLSDLVDLRAWLLAHGVTHVGMESTGVYWKPVYAVLEEAVPEDRIVWRFQNEGVDGTHGFYLTADEKRTKLTHRVIATLSDTEGRLFWRRFEDSHGRTMDALFAKLERVLTR